MLSKSAIYVIGLKVLTKYGAKNLENNRDLITWVSSSLIQVLKAVQYLLVRIKKINFRSRVYKKIKQR